METQVSSSTMRRPCFIEEDDGLASIAGFSGVNHGYPINNNIDNQPFICYNNNNNNNNNGIMMRRRNSLRNLSSLSPRSTRVFDEFHSPHFLEACALCHKPLGGNRDIFMYRGDTPFCSEECRQEQIDVDEAKEKNRSYKALRSKKETKKTSTTSTTSTSSTTSPSKTPNYPFRTGTVAAA